ncbi:MAG TPA: methyltransferase domain-containing protein [Thermoanaerobaculia bacterium]|jgi:23S rRNA (guanine745-N1)-methyltransferase|nr:methyltransferase domain-containing protein [Thermoanaerobaculia bacterium]
MVTLICTVRHCGEPLERRDRVWVCSRGHSFDVARSGYCNLLQPQDRRSPRPGDPPEAVAARRRLLDAGYGGPLLSALLEEIDSLPLPSGAAVLDAGCGEGTYLGEIARRRQVEAHGTDLSTAAIELAARRFPEVTWTIANADRLLPYATGSFELVLSIDARLNPEEMRRVLRPDGRLLVAVPAADDLIELREAVLGQGVLKERIERSIAWLDDEDFELESRSSVRTTVRLDPDAARDALAATYRGGRASRSQRIDALAAMDVTLSHDLARFRRKRSTGSSL